jgi:hypothetical protein
MRIGEPDWSAVVAKEPRVDNLWPYGIEDTIAYYRQVVAS